MTESPALIGGRAQRKEDNADITFGDDGAVQDGRFTLLLHTGVEIALQRWRSALVAVHQDVVTNPVQ